MLVGGATFTRHRVSYLLAATAVVCLPAAGWYLAAAVGWTDWPSGSTRPGLVLGMAAAAIIGFEMLLWPRKRLRGYRLGRTRTWMYWHIWLGLISVPLTLGHAGFRFGGPLTSAVLVLYLLVIASGVWGLLLQQVLPGRLLDRFSAETIESHVDPVMAYHRREADDLVARLGGNTGDPLVAFYIDEVRPYLQHGRRSGSVLQSASVASGLFADIASRASAPAADIASRLEGLCAARRQYDAQARLHGWLHGWLLLHLPLSVALCVLLVVHIVTALKYW